MNASTRTPEGRPHRCPVCGQGVVIEPSCPAGDAPCPHCGCLLWFHRTPGRETMYGFHRLAIPKGPRLTKVQALTAILDRIVETGTLNAEHREPVLAALLRREELGSTGIGRGVAIAHAKYSGLERAIGAIARFPGGVHFDSLDGQPVHLICLLVAPNERPGEHIRLLEAVARRVREPGS